MPDTNKLNQALALSTEYGQQHLFRFFDELTDVEQDALLTQILSIDFEALASLFKNLVLDKTEVKVEDNFEPMMARDWESFGIGERAAMSNQGMRALRDGKVAAFLVAGGQGTRLGHEGPKGIFDIGLPSRKSLFQLQAERLICLSRQSRKTIPWYIMTSEENHEDTVGFFRERHFFGYPERDIFFFKQGEMPIVDEQGRILLASKGCLSMGPNGNGGCFLALSKSGALADMKRRGVEYVFFYSVDNALVRVCDPHFVGFAISTGMPAASKAVVKTSPKEKVGVLCLRNGRPSVLEYSEMTDEMLHRAGPKGGLAFASANIAIHLFTLNFLEKHVGSALPFHLAHKKIAGLDEKGNGINPTVPNAYKFELFMFDLFPLAEGMAALQIIREEEFAPVKNKDGEDSPGSARELVLGLHHKWALSAGLSEEDLKNKVVEISPLISYAGEDLNSALVRSQLGNPIIHVS